MDYKKIPSLSRQELLSIPVPQDTQSYKAVSIQLIMDTIDSVCADQKLILVEELFQTTKRGNQQKLIFTFESDKSIGTPFTGQLGILNSYDRTIAFKAVSGANVRVCLNGQVLGTDKIYRKHTGDVREDMVSFLTEVLQNTERDLEIAQERWDVFNAVSINQRDINEIVGELYLNDLLNTSQMEIVKQELKEKQNPYEIDTNSLNYLYQCVTLSLRTTHPLTFLKSHKGVEEIFVNYTMNNFIL